MRDLILVVMVSLFLFTGCADDATESTLLPSKKDSEKSQQAPLNKVSVIIIEPQIISMANELPGRVIASMTAEIRPQVSGIVQARLFKEGSLVEKNQQLYQIEPAGYDAEYQSAQANLQNTMAEMDIANALQRRYQNLIETNAVSEQEFDNAKASLAKAKAAVALAQAKVKTAKINLNYTKVYAPISGYIGPSSVTVGALVTAQQVAALATIRQLDPVYVDLSQSADKAQPLLESLMASRMNGGQNAQFEVTILVGPKGATYPEKGLLFATDLAVDENTGTIRLRTVFPNPKSILLPGMFVRAKIEEAGTQESIIVPQKAVVIETDGSKAVWIVDDNNTANKRKVQTSTSYANNWVISSGLKSGDKIIVEGAMMLQQGAQVEPTNIKQKQSNSVNESKPAPMPSSEPVSDDSTANKASSKP